MIQLQSVEDTLTLLTKSLKTVLDEVHFIVNLYSLHTITSPPGKPFLPQGKSYVPSQAEQLPKLSPPLDTSTIAYLCIFFSNSSYNLAN